jgi:hypothetical protein
MSLKEVAREFDREEGHAAPLLGVLIAGAGTVLLGIGAANDTGWLAVAGGIVAAAGILVQNVLHHVTIDWAVFKRLDTK